MGCLDERKKKVVENRDANKVNLEYHWQLVSLEVQKNPNDTIFHCCTPSISFMERRTQIISQASGNFIGKLYFTKNDWLKWDAWMKENKGKK